VAGSTPLPRQIEQEPHHQGGTETFFRRFDPTLNEKRGAHPEREVERRHEPEIQPVRTAKSDPLSERPTDRMRRDKHPLGAGDVGARELRQLLNEWIHQIVSNVRKRTAP
jgi:hypothetical protein